MQRKEAEKLLAALIFDDLDEASKTELLTYLQTDNELRERLADMRMAVKVASDTVQHGPDPVLGKRRLKRLARLARGHRTRPTIFTAPRLAAAAAIFVIAALILTGIQTYEGKVASTVAYERSVAYEQSHYESPVDAPSRGEQATEITFTAGSTYDPPAHGPGAADSESVIKLPKAVINGPIPDDGRIFAKAIDEIGGIAGAKISPLRGDVHSSVRAVPTEKLDSGSSFEGKLPGGTASREGLHFFNAPEAQSQVSAGDVTVMNDENYYTKNKIGGITNALTSPLTLSYDVHSSPKTGPTEKLGSGSSWESKPHSGMGEGGLDSGYYVGGGGIMAPDPGDGIMRGYGGMGRFPSGGMGMGGYGGGGYAGGGMGGMGGGYSSNGGDGSGIMRGYRDTRFGWGWGDGAVYSFPGGKGGNGVMSGDTPVVTGGTLAFDGDKDFKGKEINWFDISSDDPMVIGDVMAVGGRVEFQNGHSAVIKKDGLGLAIDSFDVAGKDGNRRPVAIDAIKSVTVTEPELTPRTRRSFGLDIDMSAFTKPELSPLSQPMRDVSGISNLPNIKLQTESGQSHVVWEDTKKDTSYEYPSSWAAIDKSEAVSKKSDDELGTMSLHFHSEKAKPPVLTHGSTAVRQGDVSRETDEAATEYSELRSRKESEKYIADFLESADETKSLPKKGQITITDCDFSDPAEGPADKKESDPLAAFPGASMREFGRSKMGLNLGYMSDRDLQDQGGLADKKESEGVPLLGDIPLVGGLYCNYTGSVEEIDRIVAHGEARKSQPEGESEVTAVIPQSERVVKYRIDVQSAIDEQSAVGFTDIATEEAEPDLPPASRFKLVPVNPWVMSERDPFSTFALDVDTASYTLCRRYIRGGFLPPAGAVRMEEFVNYFNYQYPQRTNPTFKVHAEAAPSPFARKDQNLTLLKIGVKARTIGRDQRKAAHLIFVVDASASMGQPDRLPLVQRALDLLVNRLSEVDRVTLITCANQARLHMESIPARERDRIRQAIYAIQPAGSTNLLAGLKLGYATARRSFAPKQINHVVLCSDGVANVGQTEAEAVLDEVAADRKQGITITCVGVGYGSYNDAFMEALANRGDGSYMFLDSARQAHRVFVRQLAATLQTVARDARIQVDFNPNRVRRYRLIGYENRDIEDKRFRDDTIDAGEVGSGQCSTALYELEMIGRPSADRQEDLGTVFVRYRDVGTGQIEEISSRLGSAIVRRRTVESAPRFFLAAGAARFAEMLRQSEHAQHGNLMDVLRVVEQVSLALPLDRDVRELAKLIRKAEGLPRSP